MSFKSPWGASIPNICDSGNITWDKIVIWGLNTVLSLSRDYIFVLFYKDHRILYIFQQLVDSECAAIAGT